MIHTYEVFVDFKDFTDKSHCMGSNRYQVNAESKDFADSAALLKARDEHPGASEYDVRVTRVLR